MTFTNNYCLINATPACLIFGGIVGSYQNDVRVGFFGVAHECGELFVCYRAMFKRRDVVTTFSLEDGICAKCRKLLMLSQIKQGRVMPTPTELALKFYKYNELKSLSNSILKYLKDAVSRPPCSYAFTDKGIKDSGLLVACLNRAFIVRVEVKVSEIGFGEEGALKAYLVDQGNSVSRQLHEKTFSLTEVGESQRKIETVFENYLFELLQAIETYLRTGDQMIAVI